DEDFDVSHFISYATSVIDDIWKRGNLPIIVGGTGFWIRSLISLPDTVGVSINKKLRQELDELSVTDLHARLKKI
ncbi:tRNA (adenosine(37)-N6)-dimethylallyltransferase MiaA, partial [Candidatus Beckwithbacteria bacterium CG23_combo_of_CG06-09_8_20_14_all_34_8]